MKISDRIYSNNSTNDVVSMVTPSENITNQSNTTNVPYKDEIGGGIGNATNTTVIPINVESIRQNYTLGKIRENTTDFINHYNTAYNNNDNSTSNNNEYSTFDTKNDTTASNSNNEYMTSSSNSRSNISESVTTLNTTSNDDVTTNINTTALVDNNTTSKINDNMTSNKTENATVNNNETTAEDASKILLNKLNINIIRNDGVNGTEQTQLVMQNNTLFNDTSTIANETRGLKTDTRGLKRDFGHLPKQLPEDDSSAHDRNMSLETAIAALESGWDLEDRSEYEMEESGSGWMDSDDDTEGGSTPVSLKHHVSKKNKLKSKADKSPTATSRQDVSENYPEPSPGWPNYVEIPMDYETNPIYTPILPLMHDQQSGLGTSLPYQNNIPFQPPENLNHSLDIAYQPADVTNQAPVIPNQSPDIPNQSSGIPIQSSGMQSQTPDINFQPSSAPTHSYRTTTNAPTKNMTWAQDIPTGHVAATRVCKPGPIKAAHPGLPNCLIIGDSIALR